MNHTHQTQTFPPPKKKKNSPLPKFKTPQKRPRAKIPVKTYGIISARRFFPSTVKRRSLRLTCIVFSHVNHAGANGTPLDFFLQSTNLPLSKSIIMTKEEYNIHCLRFCLFFPELQLVGVFFFKKCVICSPNITFLQFSWGFLTMSWEFVPINFDHSIAAVLPPPTKKYWQNSVDLTPCRLVFQSKTVGWGEAPRSRQTAFSYDFSRAILDDWKSTTVP